MTAKSLWRGHPIKWDEEKEKWLFEDSNEPVGETYADRPCKKCLRPFGKDDHDPCIKNLPGVSNACCGHGDDTQSYIQFRNGVTVRGLKITTGLDIT